jgi:hypothetical protein
MGGRPRGSHHFTPEGVPSKLCLDGTFLSCHSERSEESLPKTPYRCIIVAFLKVQERHNISPPQAGRP